jgi:hypothetical protein
MASPNPPPTRGRKAPAGKKKGDAKGAKGKGAKGALNKKVLGFPAWAWAGVAVVGFVAYRHFKGTSSSGSTAPADQTGIPGSQPGSGGGSSGGDLPSMPSSLPSDLLGAIGSPTGDPFGGGDPFAGVDSGFSQPFDQGTGSSDPNSQVVSGSDKSATLAGLVQSLGVHPFMTPAGASDFASQAASRSTLAQGLGFLAPFGGVTDVRRLANGSTITSYASGRQVQQVPGKSAYVINKGGGSSPSSSSQRSSPGATPHPSTYTYHPPPVQHVSPSSGAYYHMPAPTAPHPAAVNVPHPAAHVVYGGGGGRFSYV